MMSNNNNNTRPTLRQSTTLGGALYRSISILTVVREFDRSDRLDVSPLDPFPHRIVLRCIIIYGSSAEYINRRRYIIMIIIWPEVETRFADGMITYRCGRNRAWTPQDFITAVVTKLTVVNGSPASTW